jgi:hypothetical protein
MDNYQTWVFMGLRFVAQMESVPIKHIHFMIGDTRWKKGDVDNGQVSRDMASWH